MTVKKFPPSKDMRDIGQVVFPMEKMQAAREQSSSCVGVEAALESDTKHDRSSLILQFLKRWDHNKTS